MYARDIARNLGLSSDDQTFAYKCGLVHDIGKISLPVGLIEKPGALTTEERSLMETHSVVGEAMLKEIDDFRDLAEVVRSHHERFDGKGYPDGVAGAEIPLCARIIAVADAYSAMTSDRPYRRALSDSQAMAHIASGAGLQFDPAVARAFLAILEGESQRYRHGGELAESSSEQLWSELATWQVERLPGSLPVSA
jgi:putative nucleotidyltransferase with HDIG domain